MLKLGRVLFVIMLLQVGCGDDDNNGVVIDAPGGTTFDAPGGATFDVTLSPEMEVPVCASAGAAATGTTTVVISPDESSVMVVALTFSGLSGPAIAAHLHSGAPGVAGPIVLGLGDNLTPPINRTFTADDYPSPPPEGAPADFAGFIREMKAGNTYINVHTDACMAGEIRAQLQ